MSSHKIMMTMFDGIRDFRIWKKQMYTNLSVQGLKKVLTESIKKEEVTMMKKQTSRKRKKHKKRRGWNEMRKP